MNGYRPESPGTAAGRGEAATRPMVVAAFMGTQGLGDFVCHHMCSASVARAFPGSRLVAIYRDDRPYKNFITALNPYVTNVLKVPSDPRVVMPLDWFDAGMADPGHPLAEEWHRQGLNRPDVFLVPSMMEADTFRDWGPPVKLRVLPDAVGALGAALTLSGVAADRWFACLHMRQNYPMRKDVDPGRSVDPATYLPMIARIIERQGGQVVRIGDPAMTPLPRMAGLVDLSAEAESFPLQAFAMSRARYFVGTDSGPQILSCAFKVPTALTNAITFGVWNDGDVFLPRKVTLADGSVAEPSAVLEMGVVTHHMGRLRGAQYEDNTPEQLCAVADHMFETTKDCTGWREDGPDEEVPAAGHVILPLPWHDVSQAANVVLWE